MKQAQSGQTSGQIVQVPGDRVLDALIIGAGFSGLYQLLCLRDRLGLDAWVVERADSVGGTWYWKCEVSNPQTLSGNQVQLYKVIPEPSTALLLVLGSLTLLRRKRL